MTDAVLYRAVIVPCEFSGGETPCVIELEKQGAFYLTSYRSHDKHIVLAIDYGWARSGAIERAVAMVELAREAAGEHGPDAWGLADAWADTREGIAL